MADRQTYYSHDSRTGTTKQTGISAEEGAEDRVANAKATEKLTGFTASKAGAAAGASDLPKQGKDEDLASYSARLREYRAKKGR